MYFARVAPELLTVRGNPHAAHWSRENGYRLNGNENDVYPNRVFGTDVFDVLIVRMGLVIDRYYKTDTNFPPSFYISLHAPDEIPQMGNSLFFVPTEHDVYISIRPETITTSNGLLPYLPHDRGCYFESERPLRFFRPYSQQKCHLECMTNFITKEIGCTHFAFPRKYLQGIHSVSVQSNSFGFHFAGDTNTRICTMVDMKKFHDAFMEFEVELLVNACDCLPDCTSIIYHTEVSHAPYHYYDDQEMKNIKKFYEYPG